MSIECPLLSSCARHLPISDDGMYFYNDYRACHGAGEHWQWVPCIGIEDTAFKTCLVGLGRKRQTYHLFLYNRSLNSSLNSPF